MEAERLAEAEQQGVLYPARLPTFARVPAPEAVAALVRWFWIPEWRLAPGRSSRQHLIAFPACNLVVEPEVVGLAGPATRASHRDLTGTGWGVGALLRPAAVPFFTADPASLRDTYVPLEQPELAQAVRLAMTTGDDRHHHAVQAFSDWLSRTIPPPDREALAANELADVIESDPDLRTVEEVARRLHQSPRTLQRLAQRYVGLPPLAMIRRRRLQEAAQRLRTEPGTSLAMVAADLGYADHAHLAHEFRSVLGLTLSGYRADLGAAAPGLEV